MNDHGPPTPAEFIFGNASIQRIFLRHLNNLYCIKSHLAERITELTDDRRLLDEKRYFEEMVWKTEDDLKVIDHIFSFFSQRWSFLECSTIIDVLEVSFSGKDESEYVPEVFYPAILGYLSVAYALESSLLEILKLLADQAKHPQISQLLAMVYMSNDRKLQKHIQGLIS
jgi:ferritin-like metal-binding protein YciE